jgi:outer membrane receptor protein involved in Fe transport
MSTRIVPSAVKPKPLAVALHFALAGLLAAGWAMPSVAQTPASAAPRQYDIPAGPLDEALNRYALQAGVAVSLDAARLKGLRTAGLRGSHGVDEGFALLLRGSGYAMSKTAAGYVLVQASEAKPALAPARPTDTHTPPSPPESAVELAPMVVTATRTERRADEVPASVSVLTERTLATKNRQNINDALRDFESLDFVGQQGVGHQVSPAIRGFSDSGKTTQVLVDGVALDSVVSQVMGRGGLNFTALQDVEQVEVVRGPASALYGPSAVGGVINVIPKRWKGAPGAEVLASYGTHNTQTLGAAVGIAKDNFDIRFSAYDAKSDGYKATPVKDGDGGWDLGGSDWKDNKVGLMMGFRPADNHEVTLNFQQYATRSALTYGGRPNDRQDLDGQSTSIGYRYDLSNDTNIKFNFRATTLTQKYYFDSWEWNGLATPGTVTAADLDLAYYGWRKSDSTFFQVMVDTKPIAGNQLIAGYSHDTGDHRSFGASAGGAGNVSGSKSKMDGVFVQDEHKFGALALTVGARYDRIDLSPNTVNGVPKNGSGSVANVTNPRLGARYHLTDVTSFYASYGTAYVPALNEYKFVQPSATRVDNPGLKPETSKTREIGMNSRLSIGTLRTALFHTDYEDKITLGTDLVSGKRQFQNVAVVKVDGLEIAYQGNLGHGWQPYVNFSYTKAIDYATAGASGTQSMRIAPRKFNAGVTYASGNAWSATLNARYVSDLYFNDLTDSQRADGFAQVDFKFSAKLPALGQEWEGFIACNNLTDKKYEPTNKGNWSDGRTFTVGLNGRF